MESSNFNSSTPIDANSQFPSTTLWDNVLNYSKFYIQIKSNLDCSITVNQCSLDTPSLTFSDSCTFNYVNTDQTNIFQGIITSSQISFTVNNNTNQNQSYFYFSVIYK